MRQLHSQSVYSTYMANIHLDSTSLRNMQVVPQIVFTLLTWVRGAIKKKNYQTLDIVQTSADPPPIRQVRTQKVWTLRLGSDILTQKV